MTSKRAQDELDHTDKRKKKKKKNCEELAKLCPDVEDESVKRAVKEAWGCGTHWSQGNVELDCDPFSHCIIKNFLSSQTFAENLQRELLELNFDEKSNDLYKFKQSGDLKKRKEPHIAGLRATLFGPFRSWLGDVLGVELESTVDISCARYEYTDVLLCHDDELEGRRAAFILYLVPPWESSDGGTLDLYATDSNFQPQSIVKSLVPSWNTLVLFEVSPVSFHQVREVLSQDKCRLSVSGWFHGSSLERPPRYKEPSLPRTPHLPRDETVLLEWVNPVYLDISYQEKIQEEFEDSSEIQLKDFLREEKFKEVGEALQKAQILWMNRGPPNKRCFEVASLDTLPDCVTECWELFNSEAFFLLLSNFTGLRLHYLCPADDDDEDEEEAKQKAEGEAAGSSTESSAGASTEKELSTPVCCGSIRRWSHGGYTLLHDGEAEKAEYALDLLLPFGCTGWQSEFGGFTCYVANEEDEELLTVYPEDNSLALVYRDKETLKFVKHINHKSCSADASTFRGCDSRGGSVIEQFRKVVKMADKTLDGGPWTGCVVLFLQSLCADVDLLSLYKNQNGKFIVFKVIKLTLTDSAGGLGGYEILKVHDAEPFLGVEVKFVNMAACKQFLDSYSSRALHQSFSQHAGRLFAVAQECTVETQLKASTNILDLCLDKLEVCLQHIHQSQPERLRDEEIDCLEQQLQTQALGSAPQQTPLTQEESSVPSNCFKFQNKVFEDRMLTAVDIQSFSNGVGRQWKHVGRALGKNCRALKAPAIDNLAYEYEREGLYEQAYQLLTRFIQAEGRAAKLSRLVRALEDCKLTSLAENLLEMQP